MITFGEGQLPRCNNPGDRTELDMHYPSLSSETLAVVWSRATRRYVVTVALSLWSRLLWRWDRHVLYFWGRGWGAIRVLEEPVPACLPGT